ncbi:hypothetical protein U1Q18_011086 [Sarracenia purpurea var. burkii]
MFCHQKIKVRNLAKKMKMNSEKSMSSDSRRWKRENVYKRGGEESPGDLQEQWLVFGDRDAVVVSEQWLDIVADRQVVRAVAIRKRREEGLIGGKEKSSTEKIQMRVLD